MAAHSPYEQSFQPLYPYPNQLYEEPSPSPSHQTRPSSYFQDKSNSSPNLTPFAQFLKEDDDRFYATFPAARPHNWVILGDDYRSFSGGAGFNANHGIYASPTSPVHAPNVLDVMHQEYPSPYHDPDPCSHTPYSYTLDPSSCGGIPSDEPYNHLTESVPLSQNTIQPTQPEFNSASFYPQLIADSEVNPDLHGLQHDNILHPPQPSPVAIQPSAHLHSPQLQRESPGTDFLRSPTDMTDPIFSPAPVENPHSQIYSLSPEAIVAGSPASSLPLPPSTLSPIEMPEQQFTLPAPPEPHSDSEPPADVDDSSGPSSSKAVLPKPSVKRKRRRNLSEELQSKSPRSYMYGKIPLEKPAPPPPPQLPKVPKSRPTTASQSEKKSLALACFFCRGRKIACGPQDPTSSDRTCNQCHRRSLKCEYPTESRRGMRKRKSGVISSNFQAETPNVPKLAASNTST
ncbi:hypothetical protein GYMLUDRAFT_32901 [Collybiopsis luxurians FD-317 M1]|nr:hypothetical protein GYMLUDRAFT_32901 [Collybiopsis luxurians FD-317 M1]